MKKFKASITKSAYVCWVADVDIEAPTIQMASDKLERGQFPDEVKYSDPMYFNYEVHVNKIEDTNVNQ